MVLDAQKKGHSSLYANRRHLRGKGKVAERLDLLLEQQGFFRKQTAKDASCIFRAVAEQLFYSQRFHSSVRMACVRFMDRNREVFRMRDEDLQCRIVGMHSPREWATMAEINAMSLLYKRDFVVYNEQEKDMHEITQNDFSQKIFLCQIGKNHYDSLYATSYMENAGMCQSIVYDILYSRVFGMDDVEQVVTTMLRPNSRPAVDSGIKFTASDIHDKDSTPRKILPPPFPYKVAKALDPGIYRNVEFDLWSSDLVETRRKKFFRNEILQVGSKCLVTLPEIPGQLPAYRHFAYIQDMDHDKVTLFVEGLGVKCEVLSSAVEPLVEFTGKNLQAFPSKTRPTLGCTFPHKLNSKKKFQSRSRNKVEVDMNANDILYRENSEAASTESTATSFVEQEAVPGTSPYFVCMPPVWSTSVPLPVPVMMTSFNGQPAVIPLTQNMAQPFNAQQPVVYQGPGTSPIYAPQQQMPMELSSPPLLPYQNPAIQSYVGQPLYQQNLSWTEMQPYPEYSTQIPGDEQAPNPAVFYAN